jgi:hypothetical protein
MDTLRLHIESGAYAWPRRLQPLVSLYVNERNLVDLVREVELPFASRAGKPDMAGRYVGLPARYAVEPSRHLLGEPAGPYDYTDKVTLLQCACGEGGCWPLLATITVTTNRVIWEDFEQPHRGPRSRAGHWHYEGLGPFVFARPQYEAELRRVAAETI